MTHSPAEVELSPEAAARLDDYLRQVRAALAGAPDVNPDEIEADIREHVEHELRDAPRPVSRGILEVVLARLGPPAAWGAADDAGTFRRLKALLGERLRGARTTLADRLRAAREVLVRGPEDWRLAYLSFGVFALGIVTMVGWVVTLPISYILSRAGLAFAREKGIELGARKWLLYPPVVLVSLGLLLAVALWPVAVAAPVAYEEVDAAHQRVRDYDEPIPNLVTREDRWRWEPRLKWRAKAEAQVEKDRRLLAAIPVAPERAGTATGLFVAGGALALWWGILGLVAAQWPGAVRATFTPLYDRFESRHGWRLAVPCLVLFVAWCYAARDLASAAGLF